jgi:hypothetical protein
VDATVVKMQTWPTRMRFTTVLKYCEQQWCQNMTEEVPCVVAVLLSSQIDDVESIDYPNNGQHGFLLPDLLLHLLKDIISRYGPFRRIMKFQSEPTLVPRHKSFIFGRCKEEVLWLLIKHYINRLKYQFRPTQTPSSVNVPKNSIDVKPS